MHDCLEDRRHSPLLIAQVDSAQDETTGDFYYSTLAPAREWLIARASMWSTLSISTVCDTM